MHLAPQNAAELRAPQIPLAGDGWRYGLVQNGQDWLAASPKGAFGLSRPQRQHGGLRHRSHDLLPLVGAVEGQAGVHAMTGFGSFAFLQVPLCARLLGGSPLRSSPAPQSRPRRPPSAHLQPPPPLLGLRWWPQALRHLSRLLSARRQFPVKSSPSATPAGLARRWPGRLGPHLPTTISTERSEESRGKAGRGPPPRSTERKRDHSPTRA